MEYASVTTKMRYVEVLLSLMYAQLFTCGKDVNILKEQVLSLITSLLETNKNVQTNSIRLHMRVFSVKIPKELDVARVIVVFGT